MTSWYRLLWYNLTNKPLRPLWRARRGRPNGPTSREASTLTRSDWGTVRSPLFKGICLYMGRTFHQKRFKQNCHRKLGSKRITTRLYVEDDLRVNIFGNSLMRLWHIHQNASHWTWSLHLLWCRYAGIQNHVRLTVVTSALSKGSPIMMGQKCCVTFAHHENL